MMRINYFLAKFEAVKAGVEEEFIKKSDEKFYNIVDKNSFSLIYENELTCGVMKDFIESLDKVRAEVESFKSKEKLNNLGITVPTDKEFHYNKCKRTIASHKALAMNSSSKFFNLGEREGRMKNYEFNQVIEEVFDLLYKFIDQIF